MNWIAEPADLISVAVSLLCGSIIGLEREYNNKSAGFRTMMLICLGSTIFTIVSKHGAGSDDRIAANIITGIGFIGAGVIFKDKLSVLGLTTAAVIWSTAGIGMLAGINYYGLAIILTLTTIVILAVFHRVEALLERMHISKVVYITFRDTNLDQLSQLEELLRSLKIKSRRKLISKKDAKLSAMIEISGDRDCLGQANETLVSMENIEEFYYN